MSYILLLRAAATIKIPLFCSSRAPKFSCIEIITDEMRNASVKILGKNPLVLQVTTLTFTAIICVVLLLLFSLPFSFISEGYHRSFKNVLFVMLKFFSFLITLKGLDWIILKSIFLIRICQIFKIRMISLCFAFHLHIFLVLYRNLLPFTLYIWETTK